MTTIEEAAPPSRRRNDRAYGDGAVFQTSSGRWRGSVEWGIDPRTGKRLRKWASGKTKTAVEQKLRRLRDERAGGEPATPRNRRRSELTVAAWLERWLPTMRDELR